VLFGCCLPLSKAEENRILFSGPLCTGPVQSINSVSLRKDDSDAKHSPYSPFVEQHHSDVTAAIGSLANLPCPSHCLHQGQWHRQTKCPQALRLAYCSTPAGCSASGKAGVTARGQLRLHQRTVHRSLQLQVQRRAIDNLFASAHVNNRGS
jgi:hypothetical protein